MVFLARPILDRRARRVAAAPASRRGVILLVVLVLLTLIFLLLLTLVAATAQGRRSAVAAYRAPIRQPPSRLLNEAFAQVVRGSTDQNSVLGAHSLLEDLYGNRTTLGRLGVAPQAAAGGGLAVFQATLDLPPGELAPADGVYNGRVLTFLEGPAKGRSTHVADFWFDASSGLATFQILPPRGVFPSSGDRFLINGPPFSGTGFGFQWSSFDPSNPAATRLLDAVDPVYGQPYALLPNHAAFGASGAYNDPSGPGQANEDYDAVDFQNMLLALRLTSSPATAPPNTLLPSLHRPDLINYWQQHPSGLWSDPNFRRRVILRPMPDDHPGFTGGNTGFDPVQGPWDVDNDQDGAPDSIWVDLGLPATSDAQGRLYKPLFAILCVDLDGRFNLNAHGNLNHLAANRYSTAYGPFAGQFGGGSASQTPISLPSGQGYGPAEINPGPLFGAEFRAILTGDVNRLLDGRYGEVDRLDLNGLPPQAGRTGVEDLLNQLQQFEFPASYANFSAPADFGTPPDLDGDGQMALDLRGQPFYIAYGPQAGWGEPGERLDDPYELNLSADKLSAKMQTSGGICSIDAPFSPLELSAVLRYGDVDSRELPGRLIELAPNSFASSQVRNLVTTESWDLPTPSVMGLSPEHLLDQAALAASQGAAPTIGSVSLVRMLHARMLTAGFAGDFNAATRLLLAPESIAGLRLDINRPLGDGQDDNGNLVVDEPAEALLEAAWGGVYGSPVAFDLNNDGQIDGGDMLARQIHARHLYVLAMLLADRAFVIDRDGDPANNARETARWLAQWAVNVVDFRDRDSIMTPFKYDVRPFNGWTADNNLTTTDAESDIVWGCERPQLLITETLAFHDRATEDLADPGGLTTDPANPDPDYDQRWLPEGSLFVELMNPWSAADAPAPELMLAGGAVDLSRTDAQTHESPVWRLLIVKGPGRSLDPDGYGPPLAAGDVERSIYFIDPAPAGLTGDGREYHPSAPLAPLLPNRYAVIGSDKTTYAGRRPDGSLQGNRRIELDSSPGTSQGGGPAAPNPDAPGQVNVAYNRGAGNDTPAAPGDIKPPLAIVVGQPRRLSITEPVDGYSQTNYSQTAGFNPPLDAPLDAARVNVPGGAEWTPLTATGTTAGFRRIHLQRLANPLLAYDPQTNPYRTVDSAPIDLTCFTGRSSKQDGTATDIVFAARQRGETGTPQPAPQGQPSKPNNLWKQEPLAKDLSQHSPAEDAAVADHYFPYELQQTLGYLNTPFGASWNSQSPAPAGSVSPQEYAGDPQSAFPWLTWNNRPYFNPLELLLVPACQSSQLLAQYSLFDPAASPYAPSGPEYFDGFHHLLSAFHAAPFGSAAGAAPNLYRLFEFVRAPSRFTETETYLNPNFFSGAAGGPHHFHPPFSQASNYREPGRMNINTMCDSALWQGLMDMMPYFGGSLFWNQIVANRRGDGLGANYDFNPMFPTLFVHPFRSYGGAALTPLAIMRPPTEIDATWLRSQPNALPGGLSAPLFASNGGQPHDDPIRSPYFRYQALGRLGNLVTTRSNVYAIWITMGYFDVSQGPIDAAHPDGLRFSAERGLDFGAVERHRAFYLYDRSIPVGFRRGENTNTQFGALLEQFIE